MNKFVKTIILVVVAFYVFCFIKYVSKPATTEVIGEGTIEHSVAADGIVLREETVFDSQFDGTLESVAVAGETVFKGQHIATIYKGKVDAEVQTALDIVNAKIAEHTENPVEGAILESDVSKIDTQIADKVGEIITAAYSNSYKKITTVHSDIIKLAEKKLVATNTDAAESSSLEALQAEKKKIEAKIQFDSTPLYAPVQGIYSFKIDGFEGAYDIKKIQDITLADVKELTKRDVSVSKEIKAGFPAAKLITNFDWYVVMKINTKKLADIDVGSKVSLRFLELGEKTVKAEVVALNGDGEDTAVALCSNTYVEGIYDARKVSVDLIIDSFTGLKVPVRALVHQDGKQGVFTKNEGIANFKEVKVLTQNDNYAIIEEDNFSSGNLLLYDEVFTDTEGIYDGKIIS